LDTTEAKLNPITLSYINEALRTYRADCYKATAVMIGGAAESIVLELRDALTTRLGTLGHPIPSDLNDWRIKHILDTIEKILTPKKPLMPHDLGEAFDSYWPAFTGQIRTARNDAGHPISVDPVTPTTVHASLLIFPELAKLASTLIIWTISSYN
jgi:hypothetical protein